MSTIKQFKINGVVREIEDAVSRQQIDQTYSILTNSELLYEDSLNNFKNAFKQNNLQNAHYVSANFKSNLLYQDKGNFVVSNKYLTSGTHWIVDINENPQLSFSVNSDGYYSIHYLANSVKVFDVDGRQVYPSATRALTMGENTPYELKGNLKHYGGKSAAIKMVFDSTTNSYKAHGVHLNYADSYYVYDAAAGISVTGNNVVTLNNAGTYDLEFRDGSISRAASQCSSYYIDKVTTPFRAVVNGGTATVTTSENVYMWTMNGEEFIESTYARADEIPTKVSELENDSNYVTEKYVSDKIDAIPQVDLTGYATKAEIPTKVSQLTNDSTFVNEEYVLSKVAEVQSSVDAAQNSIKAVQNSIPTKVSQLTNDKNYINKEVNNLTNYHTKEEISDLNTFGEVINSIAVGKLEAGTILTGKTVKQVLEMILGVQPAPKHIVEFIMENNIPSYSGTANTDLSPEEYKFLDLTSAEYTEEGFYMTKDNNGDYARAGYQVHFVGNSDMDAQTFALPKDAKIIKAYQYDEFGTHSWLDNDFPGSYWLEDEVVTKVVNGVEVSYQTYTYNIDDVGDAITVDEYWRFEIEVNN